MTPEAGVFGKTPETGDFVTRHLDRATRQALDRWLTAHLAPLPPPWPEGGVRGLIDLNQKLYLLTAVPSRDSARRRFPLAAITPGAGVSLEAAETWCNAVAEALLQAAAGELSVDDLLRALNEVVMDDRMAEDGYPALWTVGNDPVPCDAEGLASLFSSD